MNYIIFCYPRTGSTLLCKTLNQHPQTRCGKEAFSVDKEAWRVPYFQSMFGKTEDEMILIRTNHGITEKLLNTLDYDFSPFLTELFGIYEGFKLISSHIDPASKLWDDILGRDIRFIFLERDIIDSACSFKFAKESKVWHVERGGPAVRDEEGYLSVADFRWFCNQFVDVYLERKEKIIEAGKKHLTVKYEKLTSNWDQNLERIFNFLEVDPLKMAMPLEKRTLLAHELNVANYRQLMQIPRPIRYRPLFKSRLLFL